MATPKPYKGGKSMGHSREASSTPGSVHPQPYGGGKKLHGRVKAQTDGPGAVMYPAAYGGGKSLTSYKGGVRTNGGGADVGEGATTPQAGSGESGLTP